MLRIAPKSPETPIHQTIHTRDATRFEILISIINSNGAFNPKKSSNYIYDAVTMDADSESMALFKRVMQDVSDPLKQENAEKTLIALAQTNYPEACYEYGVRISQKKKEFKEEAKALMFEQFRKAADYAEGEIKKKYCLNYAYYQIELLNSLEEGERYLSPYVNSLDPIALTMQATLMIMRNNKDLPLAIKLLEQGKNSGHCWLLQTLGALYLDTKEPHLEREGFNIISTIQRSPHSDFILALCYKDGTGVEKNPKLALKHLAEAAAKEDSDAVDLIAQCYLKGELVLKDLRQAMDWHYKAFVIFLKMKKIKRCKELVLQIIKIGLQHNIDQHIKEPKFVETIKLAEELNDPLCFFVLGYLHSKKKDMTKAILYYTRAADLGEPRSQAILALYHQEHERAELAASYFVKAKNFKLEFDPFDNTIFFSLANYCMLTDAFAAAINYFKQAQKYGHPQAAKQIKIAQERLKKAVVKPPQIQAKQAKEAPEIIIPQKEEIPAFSSRELIEMALERFEEHNELYNPAAGIDYLLDAAKAEDPDAYYWLGWCYEVGIGVTRQLDKAEEYYRKGSSHNEPWSLNALGNILKMHGKETPQQVFGYFKLAAQLHNEYAKNNLGICLADGYGCKQDLDLALKYFIDAANEEVAEAHFNCGRWYEYVGKNISLARQHYEKAEKLGSERAKEALWQTQKVRKKRSPFNPLRK